ncbi:hypothetical protein WS71_06840 [Burkholderia mayonis]|uniref:Uncharacterized protein n=1 Tax=Burkholderia mayonis TaxID=1385591 RepID=A0A1B4FTR4_9BURK|nr:hypothetical protein WS71_06840 [Burkholderia mayonis]KVE45940.1 hypothetical protein WS71_22965 [Burkholderia mayonis]
MIGCSPIGVRSSLRFGSGNRCESAMRRAHHACGAASIAWWTICRGSFESSELSADLCGKQAERKDVDSAALDPNCPAGANSKCG